MLEFGIMDSEFGKSEFGKLAFGILAFGKLYFSGNWPIREIGIRENGIREMFRQGKLKTENRFWSTMCFIFVNAMEIPDNTHGMRLSFTQAIKIC